MNHPLSADAVRAGDPRPVDNLDHVRVLLPLLRNLPNPAALAATLLETFGSLALDYPTPGVLIILYHGHPSGDPTPARSDWALTDAVRDALATLQASLFDHGRLILRNQMQTGENIPCSTTGYEFGS